MHVLVSMFFFFALLTYRYTSIYATQERNLFNPAKSAITVVGSSPFAKYLRKALDTIPPEPSGGERNQVFLVRLSMGKAQRSVHSSPPSIIWPCYLV